MIVDYICYQVLAESRCSYIKQYINQLTIYKSFYDHASRYEGGSESSRPQQENKLNYIKNIFIS